MSGIGGARVRFPASVFRILKTGALTIQQIFDLSSLTANRTVTMPDKNGTLAMTSDIAAAADVPDNAFRISDNGDSTKKIAFEASGIDASTVRTFTAPNRNHTLGGVELWATATKYIIGDVIGISYLGSIRFYRCTTAHTAAAAFTTDVATKWTFLGAMNFESALFALMQTADPTKLLTFDLSSLTASRSVTLPDKAGTMAMLSDISGATLTDTQFLYRQALLNSNFDIWTKNTTASFTNPATATQIANNWFVRKANGGGTAPSINISKDTTIPNKLSIYSLKADVTAAGTANSTTQYEIYQSIADFKRFQGKNISISIQMIAPTASEKIDLLIDDGVSTTLIARKTVTNSWANYKYENISINSAATKLEFIFRIAGGTGLSIASSDNFVPSTTGAFYFAQCQLNEGTLAIDFKPESSQVAGMRSGNSQFFANTHAGYGGTDTKIPYFTNTSTYDPESHFTIVNNSTNGLRITINTAGLYSITASLGGADGGSCYAGITLNDTELTTDVSSITVGNILAFGNIGAVGGYQAVPQLSTTVWLNAGDIVRPHTNGTTPYPTRANLFNITKII